MRQINLRPDKAILNRTPGEIAYATMKTKYNQRLIGMAEVMMIIQMAANSLLENQVVKLTKMIEGTEYDRLTVKHCRKQIDVIIKKRETDIVGFMRRAKFEEDTCGRNAEMVIESIANMMDKGDEEMSRHLDRLDQYIASKIPVGGDCCPREPDLLKQIIKVVILCPAALSTFESNEINNEALKVIKLWRMLDPNNMVRNIDNMVANLRLKNKYGGTLRYNLTNVCRTNEIIGEFIGKDKPCEGGILCDIRNTLFSTRFIDALFIARDNQDHHFRDIKPSFYQNMKGDSKVTL